MSESTFRAKAPKLMARLIDMLNISIEDAAAIVGNAGHESAGFTKLQEIAPTVKGSRGGYGWFQWTGPRRRAFEAFCAKNHMKPHTDEANTAFVIHELRTTERPALSKLRAARGLQAKVIAFEKGYERAGVKHYPSRIRWAQIALDAWQSKPRTKPAKWAVAGGGGAAVGTGFLATFGESAASSLGYSLADLMSWQLLAAVAVITGVLAVIALVAMGHEKREKLWARIFGGWLA